MSLLNNVRDSIFGLPKPALDPSNPLPTPEQRLGLPGSAPAAAVSAGPAGAAVSGAGSGDQGAGSTEQGAGTAAAAKPARRVTKELYFEESLQADFHESRDTLRLGHIAHVWCAAQADYESAIKDLRDYARSGGLEGKALRVREQIGAWQVHELFDRETVKALHRSTICKLVPLVKRDTRTGVWAIRPGIESRAAELVAMALAEHWSVKMTVQRVAALVRRKRPAAKRSDPLKRLQSQIRRLSPEKRAELLHWLQADQNGRTVAA